MKPNWPGTICVHRRSHPNVTFRVITNCPALYEFPLLRIASAVAARVDTNISYSKCYPELLPNDSRLVFSTQGYQTLMVAAQGPYVVRMLPCPR